MRNDICQDSVGSKSGNIYVYKRPFINSYAPPLVKKEGAFFHLSVCRSVEPINVRSMSFDPFTCNLPNLVQWIPLGNKWPLLVFRSHDQRSGSNCWTVKKCLLSIHWSTFLESWETYYSKYAKCHRYMAEVYQIRRKTLSNQSINQSTFAELSFVSHLFLTSLHIYSPSEFCTRGYLCFSNISC